MQYYLHMKVGIDSGLYWWHNIGPKGLINLSTHRHLPGDTIRCSCVQALQILYAYHPKDPAFTTETCVDELSSCD